MVSKLINSSCFKMIVLRNKINVKTRIMIYYAYIYSILQNGIKFWGTASKAKTVLRIQKIF